ncbi:hypothetical protein Pla52o_18760 [Novipirellula galeiformis]|uniref:Uncharacterized protein n=1 Tax=Novipirellula galeiformis TaxID=2528004 RepID=A0A5C6CG68_9BACT|nr:hypothetical protein Pla52o_18760 [Novipirellula galeiformis]
MHLRSASRPLHSLDCLQTSKNRDIAKGDMRYDWGMTNKPSPPGRRLNFESGKDLLVASAHRDRRASVKRSARATSNGLTTQTLSFHSSFEWFHFEMLNPYGGIVPTE